MTLTAFDEEPSYGPMCDSKGVHWAVSDTTIASIDDAAANPVALVGLAQGDVTVTATAGALVGTIVVRVGQPDAGPVDAAVAPVPDAGPPTPDTGCGCAAGGSGAAPAVGLLLAVALVLVARRRRA